jgi:hypothetical protein
LANGEGNKKTRRGEEEKHGKGLRKCARLKFVGSTMVRKVVRGSEGEEQGGKGCKRVEYRTLNWRE